jgi:ligand-binding sensor domain-containing protein
MVFPDYKDLASQGRILIPNDYPVYFSGNYVFGAVEDNFGEIWVATNQGLRRFRDNPGNAVTYYSDTFRQFIKI